MPNPSGILNKADWPAQLGQLAWLAGVGTTLWFDARCSWLNTFARRDTARRGRELPVDPGRVDFLTQR